MYVQARSYFIQGDDISPDKMKHNFLLFLEDYRSLYYVIS